MNDSPNSPSRRDGWSQSHAVTRSRNITETKLKAQHALAQLTDEEEQTSVDLKQTAEAQDVRISWNRREQLCKLVDKITAIKSLLRFQEEARDADKAFKSVIRQKRAAFQVRLTRLEHRQAAERNELQHSQQRLAETVSQIRAIELKGVHDKNKVRRMIRDNEIQAQQVSMRQQKESEFLREIQLCKARHMAEINDLDILNMEEYEEILIQQRIEEFDLIAKQNVLESEMQTALERQKNKLEASQLLDKQSSIKIALQRTQRKQASNLAKSHRMAARNRERMLIGDHPIFKGDQTGDYNFDEENEEASETYSEGTSRAGGNNP
ncbi:UNVERIFIED_CONTAM: hypothetical protein HDU68_011095 [Siphonaria sp. JEL0065]|nr:hypothetical protein HDU68_011095 [Siphonaria sp. JEL0065]